jgi:hypothetical protein
LADLLESISDALRAAGVACGVPALFALDETEVTWDAVITLDESFAADDLIVSTLTGIGLRVDFISHEIFSLFNRTRHGVDEGGGKTWAVRFATTPDFPIH